MRNVEGCSIAGPDPPRNAGTVSIEGVELASWRARALSGGVFARLVLSVVGVGELDARLREVLLLVALPLLDRRGQLERVVELVRNRVQRGFGTCSARKASGRRQSAR
jgi:hypothetical protein